MLDAMEKAKRASELQKSIQQGLQNSIFKTRPQPVLPLMGTPGSIHGIIQPPAERQAPPPNPLLLDASGRTVDAKGPSINYVVVLVVRDVGR